MEYLFFNLKKGTDDDIESIYHALGIDDNVQIGDSPNVLTGVYYSYTVFGIEVKLEYNSYAYNDKYKYMISIEQDVLSDIEIDQSSISMVCKIVTQLLLTNLSIAVAHEVTKGKLEVFQP